MIRRLALAAVLVTACSEPEPPPPEPTPAKCPDEVGVLCTWAGTGEAGFDGDGKALDKTQLSSPVDVAFDKGNIGYVSDFGNHRVRRAKADGTLETFIGTGDAGDGDPNKDEFKAVGADPLAVAINHPAGLTFAANGDLLFLAWDNHKLRRWESATNKLKVVSGGKKGYAGDGGPASAAWYSHPTRVVADSKGQLFIVDTENYRVRRLAADAAQTVTSPVGSGVKGYAGDNQPPTGAQLNYDPADLPLGGVAIDTSDILYVADTTNHRIRKVDLKVNVITTVAGTGLPGYEGDGGQAKAAKLSSPTDLAIADNTLYFADTGNNVVRTIDLSTGVINTVVGKGTMGFSGDGGKATEAELHEPRGVGFDPKGALYVADTGNHRVRRVRLK